MTATTIQWTDHSINPIRARDTRTGREGHHCVKVSPGCANCYSSRMQPRFGMPPFRADKRRDVVPFFDPLRLGEVHRRKKPTRYFWCDMSDIFGDWVPDEWIDRCAATWAQTRRHTHQILTKRPERMLAYSAGMAALSPKDRTRRLVTSSYRGHPAERLVDADNAPDERVGDLAWPLPNVWLGVSVEDQATADQRIPLLLRTPGAVRWVSYEPGLAGIDFHRRWFRGLDEQGACYGCANTIGCTCQTGGLNWIVVGGESGPGARPFDLAWARSTVAQCRAAGVAVFVKQFGARPYCAPTIPIPSDRSPLRDRKGGDMAEWPEDLRIREWPEVRA